MKILMLSIFTLLITVSSITQQSGVVAYEQTTKLGLDLPPEFKRVISINNLQNTNKTQMQLSNIQTLGVFESPFLRFIPKRRDKSC